MNAYEAGRVELAQRRCADGRGFDYICQKRRNVVPPFGSNPLHCGNNRSNSLGMPSRD